MDCFQSQLQYCDFQDDKQQNIEIVAEISGVKIPPKPTPFRFEPLTPAYRPVTYNAVTLEPSIAVPGRLSRLSPPFDHTWKNCIYRKVGQVKTNMDKIRRTSDLVSSVKQFIEERSFSSVTRKAAASVTKECTDVDGPVYTGNPSDSLFMGMNTPYDVHLDQENNTAFEQQGEHKKLVIQAALTEINAIRQSTNLPPMSTSAATKFLIARDFDVEKTVALYDKYQSRRKLYRIENMSPFKNPLLEEIYSGRFTVLDTRDQDGAGIAYMSAKRLNHDHNTIINNIYFQMDEAIKSPEIQNNGLVLLYDFTQVTYRDCDIKLCAKILNLFKEAYPVVLKKVLLISPPFWLAARMRLLEPGLLRDLNVETASPIVLNERLPVTCIPYSLGGTLAVNHLTWICQCMAVHSARIVSGKQKLTKLVKRRPTYSRQVHQRNTQEF